MDLNKPIRGICVFVLLSFLACAPLAKGLDTSKTDSSSADGGKESAPEAKVIVPKSRWFPKPVEATTDPNGAQKAPTTKANS
jgi:hypothetical protein